ncbi:MAG: hypothetical protein Kow0092_34970 [Deferrisomatales bacterium]
MVHSFRLEDGSRAYLLAVLDGHGGSGAAERCRQLIPERFHLDDPADPEEALARLVGELAAETRELASGTTLSAVCVLEGRGEAVAAVLGDSPVMALDRHGRPVVGPEHNVRTNPAERARVEARGARCEGGYAFSPASGYGLQLTRALGDAAMGEILSREPELFRIPLGPASLLVVATDGLLDPGHAAPAAQAEELLERCRRDPGLDARGLLAWAEERGLLDNATVVMWRPEAPTGDGRERGG